MKIELTRVDILRKKSFKAEDYVAEERPLHVYVNQTYYATILCTPTHLKELAVGHLLTEGIVYSVDELDKVILRKNGICRLWLKPHVEPEKRHRISKPFSRVILSACGATETGFLTITPKKVESDLQVDAKIVSECVRRLNLAAKEFRLTGGVHAAAIYEGNGNEISFAEDIGRHNAVDKSIGQAALDEQGFDSCFLALTGRLTGDIVLKAARVGIPVVASLAAAIDSGIQIAKDAKLTLIGFVRGSRMNVYTHPERIIL